jgi:hypothetical protein
MEYFFFLEAWCKFMLCIKHRADWKIIKKDAELVWGMLSRFGTIAGKRRFTLFV